MIKNSHKDNDINKPLYVQAKEYLLEIIRNMTPGHNRLPPEEVLAEQFGVSRATIREALRALIRERIVTGRQGKGNFGHPNITKLNMRIDMDSDFKTLLEKNGYVFSVYRSDFSIIPSSAAMLGRMPEAQNDKVLFFDLVYQADEKPVIWCLVEIVKSHLKKLPLKNVNEVRFADFLKRHCKVDVTHSATWFRAATHAKISAEFNVPAEAPMIVWDEVFYDLYDYKICYNQIFFHPHIIDMSLLLSFSHNV